METTVQIEKIIEGYDNNQCDNTCSTVKFLVEASVEFALTDDIEKNKQTIFSTF